MIEIHSNRVILSAIINKYYNLCMSDLIKQHRRNKAVEHSEDSFRMSIPYLQLETARKSIGFTHDGPRTFRSSDTTSINFRESISYKGPKKIANYAPNPEGQKPSETSNLISTLQQLEEKLKKAQKFLQNRRS